MGRQVRVGLLVLVALAIFMVTVFTLGQQEHLWERKVAYEIHFARAGGLAVGAGVSLAGVPVGSVTGMSFPADPSVPYIDVGISVTGDVAARIRENTVATIRTYGVLGDRYIELTTDSTEAPPIAPGGLIPSIDPIDYEAVLGQSGDIVTNIVEVTASLKSVLGSIERGEGLLGAMVRNRELGESTLVDFQKTMANLQTTTRSLNDILERVDRGEGLLGRLTRKTKEGDALIADIEHSAQALDQLTTRFSKGHGAVPRLMEDEEYGRQLTDNLQRITTDLAQVTDKLQRGEGTLGKLVNDPALYHDTRSLVARLRGNWVVRLLGFGGGAVAVTPAPAPAQPEQAPAP
jgi:phospholipid/cholesterol/gamma-HCH transport system substrate-binding protein